MQQYILTYGNPADGFKYIGPFDCGDDANEYGDIWLHQHDWWVILLQKPASEEEVEE